MSDPSINLSPVPMSQDQKTMPMVVYGLYLLGVLTVGVAALIGLIIAYTHRKDAGERACSHYIFQIRTFWLAILWSVAVVALFIVSIPLAFITLGLFNVMGVWALSGLIGLWFVIRCVVGLGYIARGEAYPRPRAWLI